MQTLPSSWLAISHPEQTTVLSFSGDWLITNARKIDASLHKTKLPIPNTQIKHTNQTNDKTENQDTRPQLFFDLTDIGAIDTAGAMLIWQLYDKLEPHYSIDLTNVPERAKALLSAVGVVHQKPMPSPERINPFYKRLLMLGKATLAVAEDTYAFLSFLGQITLTLWRNTLQPWRFRFTSTVFHMEEVGLKALPIIGLLSFLIGIVISYQGAQQLQHFGADIYVINLLGVSILREIGVLMTAIIMAGRSGSAFTAQIGTMQVNQETDALRTLGLHPIELLVVPRVVALTLALPLLVLYADIMAIAGGALMCWLQLDIGLGPFLRQLQEGIGLWTLGVGLIKAPVFAFVIAVVGCYQGFRVSGSAESVGQLTTRSVVHAIFLVILLDAIFSILFAWLNI